MNAGTVYQLPVRNRHLDIDERGVGLRATWHLNRGFLNLSLWRDDRCVETFHLTPGGAGRLVGFIVSGLADAVSEGDPYPAATMPPPAQQPSSRSTVMTRLSVSVAKIRLEFAEALDRTATRLRP